jgi:hypothetical protein
LPLDLLLSLPIEPVKAVVADVDVSMGVELDALVDALSAAGTGDGGHAQKCY